MLSFVSVDATVIFIFIVLVFVNGPLNFTTINFITCTEKQQMFSSGSLGAEPCPRNNYHENIVNILCVLMFPPQPLS